MNYRALSRYHKKVPKYNYQSCNKIGVTINLEYGINCHIFTVSQLSQFYLKLNNLFDDIKK